MAVVTVASAAAQPGKDCAAVAVVGGADGPNCDMYIVMTRCHCCCFVAAVALLLLLPLLLLTLLLLLLSMFFLFDATCYYYKQSS